MALQVIFIILAITTLGSALLVVTVRNLFHAALAMMLSFLGVAGFYVILQSGFMASAQLLVYIGAISILVIFAIMMTRRLMSTTESPYNTQMLMSAFASILMFALLALVIVNVWNPQGAIIQAPQAPQTMVDGTDIEPALLNTVTELGRSLVSADGYVLPFELASVLLLAALVGSIVIARPEKESSDAS